MESIITSHSFVSSLYGLRPLNIGRVNTESLTSYVSRLSEAHCVPAGVLMESKVAPIINRVYGGGNLHQIYEATAALNGTGTMASDLVEALKQLTRQSNLQFLTLLPWSRLLPTKKLLRRTRAWCPTCYESAFRSGEAIYEPLIWSLEVIRICSRHHQLLKETCPHCKQKNLPLAWQSRPGYCSKCLRWLGSSEIDEIESFSGDELKWALWTVSTVEELIAAGPLLHISPAKQQVAHLLKTYVGNVTSGNVAEFARRIQVPRNTFWLWCEGRNQPQLEALLKISYCLNVSLLEFLTTEVTQDEQSMLRSPVSTPTTFRAEPKQINLKQLEKELEKTLLNHDCPPPSMEEVAKHLNLNRRTILRHFPEMCHAISAKYVIYKKAAQLSSIRQCKQEVKVAVNSLYSHNLYPSESRVSALLSKPGFLRYEEVRASLKEARAALGI
ncbi:helix-turn-helix domain-containing protein [Phormidium tenue FACHB-886]|nr:helix-turn-helix domain-containing protein [Phormidium tenue FACHB-886]